MLNVQGATKAGIVVELPSHIKHRAHRVRLHRKGVLEYDHFSCACLIEEVSQGGFLIACLDEFAIGQHVALTSELCPGERIHCVVEVRHINDYSLGVAIVDMDEDSAKLCQELMNEYYALARRAT